MTSRQKMVAGVAAAAILGTAAGLGFARSRDQGIPVRLETVSTRDLHATVTASGNIRARQAVDLSSDVSARVASLDVQEGDDVTTGQVLLRLDPTQFEAAVARARASLSQAEAQAAQQRANLLRADRDLGRVRSLYQRDTLLVSLQQLEGAETDVEVAQATLEAAQHGVDQARAALEEAQDRLSKTILQAPISGKVTRLNVEEGETVIVGTMNNPGSLILTVSDLSVVEVVVQVDETDVPELARGDSASVQIDAFPDVSFTGRVTQIGNSAIRPPASTAATGQQAAIDFEVVLTLDEPSLPLRPDLSATAEIVTDVRKDALAVPIIALTVRDASDSTALTDEDDDHAGEAAATRALPGGSDEEEPGRDVEGVFVVRNGTVRFTPVVVGIPGREHFEVVSGLAEGDTVVAGPYQTVRDLRNGDRVGEADPEGVGALPAPGA